MIEFPQLWIPSSTLLKLNPHRPKVPCRVSVSRRPSWHLLASLGHGARCTGQCNQAQSGVSGSETLDGLGFIGFRVQGLGAAFGPVMYVLRLFLPGVPEL